MTISRYFRAQQLRREMGWRVEGPLSVNMTEGKSPMSGCGGGLGGQMTKYAGQETARRLQPTGKSFDAAQQAG